MNKVEAAGFVLSPLLENGYRCSLCPNGINAPRPNDGRSTGVKSAQAHARYHAEVSRPVKA